ncbi:MAG: GDYXXLXY domain-containing protein [Pelosinus sp.]|nr:GDYXXLXY domain-containing protein [Pelosinus sp.]
MREKLKFNLFVVVAVLQLFVPLYMMWHWENILTAGQQYYWRTAPVDPYDALRGRYVRLSFKEMKGKVAPETHLQYGQTAYASIAADENGYAYISLVSAAQPETGQYLKVKVIYLKGDTASVQLPFNRFYMREDLASSAEQAYTRAAGKEGAVAVRVKDGLGVVEELYIGDKTITEYLRENK